MIKGQGFLRDGAPPNNVVFGTVAAPLAAASDDETLVVETPPNAMAGDVPVIVFNRNDQETAMGMFHYSAQPTITMVAPNEVLYNSDSTTVTLTGTGFKDENAGLDQVLIDGTPAVDVVANSDTSLTFTAVPGQPLEHPTIEVVNARGSATAAMGYRYIPSNNPSLIVFPNNTPGTFLLFYDPTANATVTVPSLTGSFQGYRATFEDSNGDYWAVDRSNNFGKIDFLAQQLINPITLSFAAQSFAVVGTTVYAINKSVNGFGTLNPTAGTYTGISTGQTTSNCCQQIGGGAGLAAMGNTLYFATGAGISTINTTSGLRGAVTTLSPQVHLGKMRFVGTTLFGMTPTGPVTINPMTGAVGPVKSLGLTESGAMEVFTP